MTTNPPKLALGTDPLILEGGSTGVLLSHGFTGSPASMVPWGRDLAARGYTVSVPRLPGHGTTWKEMNTTGWENWYGELDTALTALKSNCDQVVVAGLSMGGCLALRLAQVRHDDVDAVVLVNPAIALKNFALRLVPALKYVVPALPGIGNDIKKPGMDERGYDKTPLRALASQLKMWKDVNRDLARVTQPLLLFRSDEDHVVDATSMDLILNGVSSEVADFHALHDSYHVATIDNDAPFIFDTTAEFIEAHVGAARA